MAIDHITPENFDPSKYPPAAQSTSYDPRQYMPCHCIAHLLSLTTSQKIPRKSAKLFIGQIRGIANGLDPAKSTQLFEQRPSEIGIHGTVAEAAEMNRLRHLADYLETRINEFPDV